MARLRLFLLGFGHGSGNLRRILRAGWPDTLERMLQEASRYGFVLSNQTNLNRPRIGESTDRGNLRNEPGGRTPGKNASGGLPVWFRAKQSDKPEPATESANPRIGGSEANPESRVAGHLERMPQEASLPVWFRAKKSDKPDGSAKSTDRGI